VPQDAQTDRFGRSKKQSYEIREGRLLVGWQSVASIKSREKPNNLAATYCVYGYMIENFNLIAGTKVVCMNGRFNRGIWDWGDQLPKEGGIYTICKALSCRDIYTGKGDIGLQFEELQNHGDRLAFSAWRFKPLDTEGGAVIVTDAQGTEDTQSRRIRELEEQNQARCLEIERLQEEKRKLAYSLEWLEENCQDFQTSEQAVSDAADEVEARCARKLYLLEKVNRELDAENELIARERDALQIKIVELESICEQQKATIQGFSDRVKNGEDGG